MADGVLVVHGAGGHGLVVAEAAREMGVWERIVFFDDSDANVAAELPIVLAEKRERGDVARAAAVSDRGVQERDDEDRRDDPERSLDQAGTPAPLSARTISSTTSRASPNTIIVFSR